MISFYFRMLAKKPVAFKKYPDSHWAMLTPIQMMNELQKEVEELKIAMWHEDLTGEHGILAECVESFPLSIIPLGKSVMIAVLIIR